MAISPFLGGTSSQKDVKSSLSALFNLSENDISIMGFLTGKNVLPLTLYWFHFVQTALQSLCE